MNPRTITWTCKEPDCGEEVSVVVYPPERSDGTNPPTPAEVDPNTCTFCGSHIDPEEVWERLQEDFDRAGEDRRDADADDRLFDDERRRVAVILAKSDD